MISVIKFKNGIFNPEHIASIFKEYIKGSNPYYTLEYILF